MTLPSIASDGVQSDSLARDTHANRRPAVASNSLPRDYSILLVDDDHAVLKSLGRVLACEGWKIITASNGEEALARLAERQPDLLITDLCMKDVNGWDLLYHEKLQRPGMPIFVITALPPSAVGGADRFATEFYQKPLDLDVMLSSIRRRLGAAQHVSASTHP